MAWWDSIFAGGKRQRVDVDRLVFDRDNPRFTPDKQPANTSDAAIIEYMNRTADLGELILSIASSGYVDIEPLIVMGRKNELVVLEGNRRLAALKCLKSKSLAAEAGVSVPDYSPKVADTLSQVTAFLVEQEAEARNLIGFKHINGPQGWDAYAKARYAAKWLDEENAKGSAGISLNEIAARMGDKHDTLYRIVSAVYVLDQAEERDLFQVSDRAKKNFSFSHLYTALTYTEFREFIGLPRADRSENPTRDPISATYIPNLKLLLQWLYGSKSEDVEPAIKTQAADLGKLKRVLGHPLARRVMMERSDLVEALTLTVDGSERFIGALLDAHAAIRIATEELPNAEPDEESLNISADVRSRAVFIAKSLMLRASDSDDDE